MTAFLRPIVAAAGVGIMLLGVACTTNPGRVWTPESADLVFMSNRDGNAEIYLISTGSSEWTNLTKSQASENWPEWSPDGRQIAYQSSADGNLDIWVMNADESGARRLTDNPAHDYVPAWSPDGTQLTFASWRREPGDTVDAVHIYVMNADGSEQRRLFADSPGTSTPAQWSPDGKSFLLTKRVGDQRGDLFIVDATGEPIRRLTNDDAYNGGGAFSPDGQSVAFDSDRGEESDIVIINADGSSRRTVVSGGSNYYPRWSPDGQWLVYTAKAAAGSDDDLDIYAVPADGESAPRKLAGSPGREAEGRWQPRR
jgi:TolB protein